MPRGKIRSLRNRLVTRVESSRIRFLRSFDYIPAMVLSVSVDGLSALAGRGDILTIEPDLVLKPHTVQGIEQLGATAIRDIYGGSGVAIAICDTGIDYTPSRLGNDVFANEKIIGGYDYGGSSPYSQKSEDADPIDTVGHGTHCAGIAAGNANPFKIMPVASLLGPEFTRRRSHPTANPVFTKAI